MSSKGIVNWAELPFHQLWENHVVLSSQVILTRQNKHHGYCNTLLIKVKKNKNLNKFFFIFKLFYLQETVDN